MFLPICAFLSLVLFSDLPPSGGRFEMAIGYQAGIRNETRGLSGLASVISRYLASTSASRSLSLAAYAAGGEVEFFDELDRTGMRISVPLWAKPMLLDQVAAYFGVTPGQQPDLLERARLAALESAAPRRIEDEIRIALLGSHPYHHPSAGWASDLEQATAEDLIRFFNENYGTDRAFVLMSSPVPGEVRQRVQELTVRTSRKIPEFVSRLANAERTFRVVSGDPAGAVIFAAPVPGVFYRGWFSALMLDRLIRRTVPGPPATTITPTLDPYYWRLQLPVPAGKFAESLEENLLQEINRLQFARARVDDLESARRDATGFLNGRSAVEWFASLGLEGRRQEGLQWVRSFTADDMRAAARDLLIMNRVIVSWPPKPKQNTVEVESLSPSAAVSRSDTPGWADVPLSPVSAAAFPSHIHPEKTHSTPEKLQSGVWAAASSEYAVFLSGAEVSGVPEGDRRTGPNGTLWKFTAGMDGNVVREFQKYRADRILVLAPRDGLDRQRALWSVFKSNERDAAVIAPLGRIANIDVPALIVLKAAIDRRLMEAGWWHRAALKIDVTLGATLDIEATPEVRAKVQEWIQSLAASPLPEPDLAWAREVAIHHLDRILPDVQSILWQRVPDYMLQDFETITAAHVQDVAKLYF